MQKLEFITERADITIQAETQVGQHHSECIE